MFLLFKISLWIIKLILVSDSLRFISGIILIILGLIQISFSIYYFYLSKRQYIPELPKGKKTNSFVAINTKLLVKKIDIEKFIQSADLYSREMNKTSKSIYKATGIVTVITGILTLLIGFLQLFIN